MAHSALRMAVQNEENLQNLVKEATVKEAATKNQVKNENLQECFTSKRQQFLFKITD